MAHVHKKQGSLVPVQYVFIKSERKIRKHIFFAKSSKLYNNISSHLLDMNF